MVGGRDNKVVVPIPLVQKGSRLCRVCNTQHVPGGFLSHMVCENGHLQDQCVVGCFDQFLETPLPLGPAGVDHDGPAGGV